MNSGLSLADSRVSFIERVDGVVAVHFSHAHIYKARGRPGRDAGSEWSQEAELVFLEASVTGPLPELPNSIAEGYLEVGGIRHETLPLPFRRKVGATLRLEFIDGSRLEIVGEKPMVELLGKSTHLGQG